MESVGAKALIAQAIADGTIRSIGADLNLLQDILNVLPENEEKSIVDPTNFMFPVKHKAVVDYPESTGISGTLVYHGVVGDNMPWSVPQALMGGYGGVKDSGFTSGNGLRYYKGPKANYFFDNIPYSVGQTVPVANWEGYAYTPDDFQTICTRYYPSKEVDFTGKTILQCCQALNSMMSSQSYCRIIEATTVYPNGIMIPSNGPSLKIGAVVTDGDDYKLINRSSVGFSETHQSYSDSNHILPVGAAALKSWRSSYLNLPSSEWGFGTITIGGVSYTSQQVANMDAATAGLKFAIELIWSSQRDMVAEMYTRTEEGLVRFYGSKNLYSVNEDYTVGNQVPGTPDGNTGYYLYDIPVGTMIATSNWATNADVMYMSH